MRRLILFAAALSLSLSACAVTPPVSTTATAPPSRADTISAVADTAVQVADAIGQAPPATLSRTTIDEKVVRGLFVSADRAYSLIDALVAGGVLVRNSPSALAVKRGVLDSKAALVAASAAQRAGSADSYVTALRQARVAFAALQSALTQ